MSGWKWSHQSWVKSCYALENTANITLSKYLYRGHEFRFTSSGSSFSSQRQPECCRKTESSGLSCYASTCLGNANALPTGQRNCPDKRRVSISPDDIHCKLEGCFQTVFHQPARQQYSMAHHYAVDNAAADKVLIEVGQDTQLRVELSGTCGRWQMPDYPVRPAW